VIKSAFSYVKLIAVAAVLAVALVSSMRPSAATTGPRFPAPDVDLRNEQQVITRYADDLIVYENQTAELGKRAALVNTDVEPLQRKSDDLKGRLSGVQNAVRDIVRKLKAANEWDDLDTRAAARINDARHRAFFQDSSFKQLLIEQENIGSQANEISSPLDALRRKVTSRNYGGSEVQMVRAAFTEPAAFESGSIGCRIGRLGLKIVIGLGGTPSREQSDRVFNRCHPDGTINPF
jgi:small-conductance mechanosensitive channel